jgi:hypothetical protein
MSYWSPSQRPPKGSASNPRRCLADRARSRCSARSAVCPRRHPGEESAAAPGVWAGADHPPRRRPGSTTLHLVEAAHTADLPQRVQYSHLPDGHLPGQLQLPGTGTGTGEGSA